MVSHDRSLFGLANVYMHQLKVLRRRELSRLYVLFRRNASMYALPLLENEIKMGNLDHYAAHKYLRWDDACITINYLDYVLRRADKYKLTLGPLTQKKYPNHKEDLKQKEDELVDYFLYEMRKEPVEQQEIPAMPLN